MKLKSISYAFAVMASVCFITGIAVLSQPEQTEGTETKWIA